MTLPMQHQCYLLTLTCFQVFSKITKIVLRTSVRALEREYLVIIRDNFVKSA